MEQRLQHLDAPVTSSAQPSGAGCSAAHAATFKVEHVTSVFANVATWKLHGAASLPGAPKIETHSGPKNGTTLPRKQQACEEHWPRDTAYDARLLSNPLLLQPAKWKVRRWFPQCFFAHSPRRRQRHRKNAGTTGTQALQAHRRCRRAGAAGTQALQTRRRCRHAGTTRALQAHRHCRHAGAASPQTLQTRGCCRHASTPQTTQAHRHCKHPGTAGTGTPALLARKCLKHAGRHATAGTRALPSHWRCRHAGGRCTAGTQALQAHGRCRRTTAAGAGAAGTQALQAQKRQRARRHGGSTSRWRHARCDLHAWWQPAVDARAAAQLNH